MITLDRFVRSKQEMPSNTKADTQQTRLTALGPKRVDVYMMGVVEIQLRLRVEKDRRLHDLFMDANP